MTWTANDANNRQGLFFNKDPMQIFLNPFLNEKEFTIVDRLAWSVDYFEYIEYFVVQGLNIGLHNIQLIESQYRRHFMEKTLRIVATYN